MGMDDLCTVKGQWAAISISHVKIYFPALRIAFTEFTCKFLFLTGRLPFSAASRHC